MAGKEIERHDDEPKPIVVRAHTRSLPKVRQPNRIVVDETWTNTTPAGTESYRSKRIWERKGK